MSWPQTDPNSDERVVCEAVGCTKKALYNHKNPSSGMEYRLCSQHKRKCEQGYTFGVKYVDS